jgi:hypothetical protein
MAIVSLWLQLRNKKSVLQWPASDLDLAVLVAGYAEAIQRTGTIHGR